jgi:hypothetical protein
MDLGLQGCVAIVTGVLADVPGSRIMGRPKPGLLP